MRLRYMFSYILAGYAVLSGAGSFGLVPAATVRAAGSHQTERSQKCSVENALSR